MEMPTITIDDIRALAPCYDPGKYLPEGWQGTILDILRIEECPADDRLWVAIRPDWLDDRIYLRFAIWCARWAIEQFWPNPDPRSLRAIEVAERFFDNTITKEELVIAQNNAYTAFVAANQDPEGVAEVAFAADAAFAATLRRAWRAARFASMNAANAAGQAAGRDSARAWKRARKRQVAELIRLIEEHYS